MTRSGRRADHEGGDVRIAGGDGVFAATGVSGLDPNTGRLGDSPSQQFRRAFANLKSLLRNAGLSIDQVGRVTVFIGDRAYRPLINPPWLECFPDPASRPARKTTTVPLAAGACVELEAVGVCRGDRLSVEIPGLAHRDPLPMAVRVGSYLFSSVISPQLPGGDRAQDLVGQLFKNMLQVVSAAGGGPEHIANVWVYLGQWDLLPEIVTVWTETFPNDASRPTRKTFSYPETDVQLQVEAVIGARRENFELEGISHHDPIPLAATTGQLFTSSGIAGTDPVSGRRPSGVRAQAKQALANLDGVLSNAGYSRDDLVRITGLVGDRRYIEEFDSAVGEHCTSADRPAVQFLELGIPGRDSLVQLIACGAK